MPIQLCPTHQLPENIICCEGTCLQRYCPECFLQHNQEHNFGVTLNDRSKQSLIEWNRFLLTKFKDIQNNIKSKGISAIFQMKLLPNYPKGLLGEISNSQVSDVGVKIIEDYLNTLATNIEFISSRSTLDELDIPELLKDIYGFFVYDGSRSLSFLGERVQSVLKQRFPEKKMYDFVSFTFVPKEFRLIEVQRKKLVKSVETQVIIQLKPDVKLASPILSRSKISEKDKSSPLVRSGAFSPRKQLLRKANEDSRSVSSSGLNESQVKQIEKVQSPQKFEAKIQQTQPEVQKVEEKQEEINIKFEKQPQFIIEKQGSFTKLQDVKEATILFQKTEPIACSTPSQVSVVQQVKNEPEPEPEPEPEERKEGNNDQIIDLTKKNEELNHRIEVLQGKVNQKQRSIRELNKLNSNEEEELLYRENEVEILTQEIHKLISYKQKYEQMVKELQKAKSELKFKQKSITQLNKLIGNEEEQIQFRESEVETLTAEIRKLVEWKSRCEEIEFKLNQKQKQLDLREKGIKQLNNVIGNQQEELAFRESEVEALTSDLKKAHEAKAEADNIINQLEGQTKFLEAQNDQLMAVVKGLEGEVFKLSHSKKDEQTFDEQLMEEVIELQSQVVARNQDIKSLSEVINKFQKFIPEELRGETIATLKSLRTVKIGN